MRSRFSANDCTSDCTSECTSKWAAKPGSEWVSEGRAGHDGRWKLLSIWNSVFEAVRGCLTDERVDLRKEVMGVKEKATEQGEG